MDYTTATIRITASLLSKTWRYAVSGALDLDPSGQKTVIYCVWHCYVLPTTCYFFKRYRNTGLTAVASSSRDGDRISAIIERWGGRTIRGSSSRRGVTVVRQCVRALQEKRKIFITPDGPRGPRCRAKKGAAQVAALTGCPVVPLLVSLDSCWQLRSWDRFVVPKPFAAIGIRYGDAIEPISPEGAKRSVDEMTDLIQKAMTV